MKISGICGDCGHYYKGSSCPNCESVASGHTLHIINDIPEHYNRGLGMVIKNRQQYNAELKEKGLIEVGNEKNYVSQEHNDKLQAQKEDKIYSGLRKEAMRQLHSMEGNPKWN